MFSRIQSYFGIVRLRIAIMPVLFKLEDSGYIASHYRGYGRQYGRTLTYQGERIQKSLIVREVVS